MHCIKRSRSRSRSFILGTSKDSELGSAQTQTHIYIYTRKPRNGEHAHIIVAKPRLTLRVAARIVICIRHAPYVCMYMYRYVYVMHADLTWEYIDIYMYTYS